MVLLSLRVLIFSPHFGLCVRRMPVIKMKKSRPFSTPKKLGHCCASLGLNKFLQRMFLVFHRQRAKQVLRHYVIIKHPNVTAYVDVDPRVNPNPALLIITPLASVRELSIASIILVCSI